jgi:hypothetical protein
VGHITLENVRNPKGSTNFTNVPLSAILHHAGVADHPEIANAGELGQNIILNAIGENGLILIVAQSFERQNSDADCCWWVRRADLPRHHRCTQSQRQQQRCHSSNNRIPPCPAPNPRRRRKGPRCDRLPFQPAFEVFGKIAR